jgi:uncharacterized membrane protein YeaQ/YmgE (transglycosylase-associated protein family)
MSANIIQILIMLGIGAVAGWLAGIIMKGAGFGLVGNIIVGIIGSFIGGFVGNFIEGAAGFHLSDIWGAIVWATVGAVILLFIIGLVKRAA